MNGTTYISVADVMIDLIERTGDGTLERLKPTIARWIKLADLKIGTPYQFKRKNVVINLDGNEGVLPADWVLIEHVALGDHSDVVYNYYDYFSNVVQTIINSNLTGAQPVVFYWSSGTFSYNFIDWVIQGDKLIFPYDYLNETQATVVYLAYETDETGLPKIRATHLEAVRTYVEVQLLKLKRWTFLNKVDLRQLNALTGMIKDIQFEYERFVQQARAEDSRMTEPTLSSLSYMYNNPYSGKNNYLIRQYAY